MADGDPGPVAALLTLGETEPWGGKARDYRGLGLTAEHVPALIELAGNVRLYEEGEDPAYWGPPHAWEALLQLRATEAIEPLVAVMGEVGEDEDYAKERLPEILGELGPGSIEPLARLLADESRSVFSRVSASVGLSKVGECWPDSRERVVATLAAQLQRHAEVDPELNGFVITALMDLRAVETMDLIREAYAAHDVDQFLVPLHEVELEFGLRLIPPVPAALVGLEPRPSGRTKASAQEKRKRKQAKESRKRNRRKR